MQDVENLMGVLLRNRGIEGAEAKEKFLRPNYERDFYDPFLMHDMERACVRIFEAVEAKELITVYSDYDCDGIPGAVVLHDFFKQIGYENVHYYIPHRHDEGYGLHMEAIKGFIEDGTKLLITIDLGITAVAETAEAQANGIDVIITDHHIPHEILPKAYAIVNPKLGSYPDSMLCGAGVVFKLVQGLIKKYGEYWKIKEGAEKWLLDMAGLATLSDMVPLVNENRAIAFFGIKVLQKSPRLGLRELFSAMKIEQRYLTEEDITFMVTPRLNAASRMDDPDRAFELLVTEKPAEAIALATHLTKINDTRKTLVAGIMKDVHATLKDREECSVIVVGNPKWQFGVLGLVAGKLTDHYGKPAFVWGQNGDSDIKGSCRSDGTINVVELMTHINTAFMGFGGHELAGGFSVSREEIHFLPERIEKAFHELTRSTSSGQAKEKEEGIGDVKVDAKISVDSVDADLWKVVEQFSPCGLGNPKPTFLFETIEISEAKLFGKEKNHLELKFKNSRGKKITAIAFFKTFDDFSIPIEIGNKINLIATLEFSRFAGKNEIRLRIVDILK